MSASPPACAACVVVRPAAYGAGLVRRVVAAMVEPVRLAVAVAAVSGLVRPRTGAAKPLPPPAGAGGRGHF